MKTPLKAVYEAFLLFLNNKEMREALEPLMQENVQILFEHTKTEEPRRSKRLEPNGNKYDEAALLRDLRGKFTIREIWTEGEAAERLGEPGRKLSHLLTKAVNKKLGIKKGYKTEFSDFADQRGELGIAGCRVFYQLLPSIYEVATPAPKEELAKKTG